MFWSVAFVGLIVGAVLSALKLCGLITWAWVTAPIWAPFAIVVFSFAAFGLAFYLEFKR